MNPFNTLISSLLVGSVLVLTGCASQPEQTENLTPPQRVFEQPGHSDLILSVNDPLESFNRMMYNFNARFDRYVFLPAVGGYKWVTPDPLEKGVSNFFDNLREPLNVINNALQFELIDSGVSLARFVVNSTFGLAGLLEAADTLGLYEREEDFGATLGTWGVGEGVYLVLPLAGPSTLRDASGLVVEVAINNNLDLLNVYGDANKDDVRLSADLLKAVNLRANTHFRYYETGTPFEYELIRFAYIEVRKTMIEREED